MVCVFVCVRGMGDWVCWRVGAVGRACVRAGVEVGKQAASKRDSQTEMQNVRHLDHSN